MDQGDHVQEVEAKVAEVGIMMMKDSDPRNEKGLLFLKLVSMLKFREFSQTWEEIFIL